MGLGHGSYQQMPAVGQFCPAVIQRARRIQSAEVKSLGMEQNTMGKKEQSSWKKS
jgi:hypothetical protein